MGAPARLVSARVCRLRAHRLGWILECDEHPDGRALSLDGLAELSEQGHSDLARLDWSTTFWLSPFPSWNQMTPSTPWSAPFFAFFLAPTKPIAHHSNW